MDTDRLTKRLMATFLGELEDHLRSLERDLLALEKQPAPPAQAELFKTLFRTAHSLKGASRSVGVKPLEDAGHRLEDLFAAGRDGKIPLDTGYFDQILPAVDEIRAAGRALRGEHGDDRAKPEAAPSIVPGLEDAQMAGDDGQWSGVIRVDAGKLDALLAQSGELLLVRHRAAERIDAVGALQIAAARWRKDWLRTEQKVADLIGLARQSGEGDEEAATPRRQTEQLFGASRAGFSRLMRDLQQLAGDLDSDRRALEQTAQWIDTEVHRVRMLPFEEACAGLGRMVRDLVASSGKRAEIAIEGGELEIDRSVLDGLKDPLLHLVRNAVDHGIEPAAARRAAGKPEFGRITLSASIRGSRVEIVVRDDGAGLNVEAIREAVRKRRGATGNNDGEFIQHIFDTGFTTAPAVTALSGRGVGLEVVKSKLQAMRGSVEVDFTPGQGTQFTLRVPLTLTSLRALIVAAGRQIFAIDTASVDTVLRIGAADVKTIEGREVVMLRGRPVAIVALTQLLGVPESPPVAAGERRPALVLAEGGRQTAFLVDDIQAQREIVVRPFGRRLRRLRYISGPTLLPDGRVALIVNSADLLDGAKNRSLPAGVVRSMAAAPVETRKRLLLVDDSITTRTLEKSILEGAGYDVTVATDGEDAWRLLLERGADLVVSDVEMPRMDGFSLTETIRRSKLFRDLPVILMTARDSDADKAQGLKVGANAYLFKSTFDQRDLIAAIEQIL